jgi:hypothetical protein
MLKSRIADRRFQLLTLVFCVAYVAITAAQEWPTPASSQTQSESPSPSTSPDQSVPPSATPEQTPSPSTARSVRISFIPPPMEGTISLGIYDHTGKLVRVLHQNAQLNDFTIGPDALVTRWDGKDDGDQDLSSGRYHARGYVVGPLKREDLGATSPASTETEPNVVRVRLIRNPLRKDKRPVVELSIAFTTEGSYLKTSDGLPLFKISDAPNVTRTGITAKSENAVDIWLDDGTTVHQYRVSSVDQMMAFDCGEFELK